MRPSGFTATSCWIAGRGEGTSLSTGTGVSGQDCLGGTCLQVCHRHQPAGLSTRACTPVAHACATVHERSRTVVHGTYACVRACGARMRMHVCLRAHLRRGQHHFCAPACHGGVLQVRSARHCCGRVVGVRQLLPLQVMLHQPLLNVLAPLALKLLHSHRPELLGEQGGRGGGKGPMRTRQVKRPRIRWRDISPQRHTSCMIVIPPSPPPHTHTPAACPQSPPPATIHQPPHTAPHTSPPPPATTHTPAAGPQPPPHQRPPHTHQLHVFRPPVLLVGVKEPGRRLLFKGHLRTVVHALAPVLATQLDARGLELTLLLQCGQPARLLQLLLPGLALGFFTSVRGGGRRRWWWWQLPRGVRVRGDATDRSPQTLP